MRPFYITVAQELHLIIIPDTDAHLDGHAAISYSYTIYKNSRSGNGTSLLEKETSLHLTEHRDPHYIGIVLFESPDNKVSYRADGEFILTEIQIKELVEKITKYRITPADWNIL